MGGFETYSLYLMPYALYLMPYPLLLLPSPLPQHPQRIHFIFRQLLLQRIYPAELLLTAQEIFKVYRNGAVVNI